MTVESHSYQAPQASGRAVSGAGRLRRRVGARRVLSLRARLLAGAGLIALVSLGAASLVAYGARETITRIDVASAAQTRLETLGTLSARINDYALVAVEAARSGVAGQNARLSSRAEIVRETFASAATGLAETVEAARALPETEQMARATRSLGLARMQAQFEALDRRLSAPAFENTPERLRAELDSFATRFSPLLDRQIVEERRARDQAFEAIRSLAKRLVGLAVALTLATVAALVLFHSGLVKPLLDRLGRFGAVARAIGGGETGVRIDVDRRDELGLVSSQINRMAARLDRRAKAVARDRRRLEQVIAERTEELSRTNARLERIDASRRRFFADIGHELRTPLTVIRAEADLAAGDGTLAPEEARRSFAVIRDRAVRLNRRVNDLLRVARSESGEIALDQRPFDLSVAAREAVEEARFLAEQRRIRLETGEPPALPAIVIGDADWTRQVVAGLIDNAVRHSPEGGIVRVGCTADADTATVFVTDEGDGIAGQDLETIFERFRRADADTAGFGIGLALAKWVVERQSGRIACTSPAPAPLSDPPKGPGAEFRVTFPREDAA